MASNQRRFLAAKSLAIGLRSSRVLKSDQIAAWVALFLKPVGVDEVVLVVLRIVSDLGFEVARYHVLLACRR